MSAEVADVLTRAADRIERDGWVQGESSTADGRCCALGALDLESQDLRFKTEDYRAARDILVATLDLPPSGPAWSITSWNDAPDRTADEVIAALRAASEAAR